MNYIEIYAGAMTVISVVSSYMWLRRNEVIDVIEEIIIDYQNTPDHVFTPEEIKAIVEKIKAVLK